MEQNFQAAIGQSKAQDASVGNSSLLLGLPKASRGYKRRNQLAWICSVGSTLERLLIVAFARLTQHKSGDFVFDMAKMSHRCLASEDDVFSAIINLQRAGHITIFLKDGIQKILVHPKVLVEPKEAQPQEAAKT